MKTITENIMNTWNEANIFLFNMKEGDSYKTSTTDEVKCVKRTKNRITLSNGVNVTIKEIDGYKYLWSKSAVRSKKSYQVVDQVLRDIEGYLVYKIHTPSNYFGF